MACRVFIDGREGTTGLQLFERLKDRTDIELLKIEDERRKDEGRRSELFSSADIVFLCLPDAAAIEAAELVTNSGTRIIDASTAHRTDPGWVYGFPELSAERRGEIAEARRVANPGCHATGFISIVAPLVSAGLLEKTARICSHSVTGYSGGGKRMIADYEAKKRRPELGAPRHYSLGLKHKHLPEMIRECGLETAPVFSPILADFYAGISTAVQLFIPAERVHAALERHYAGEYFVKVMPLMGGEAVEDGQLGPDKLAGTNFLEIYVFGNEEQAMVVSCFDNLGKGASGAAVQNMNIMLGLDEKEGL